VHKTTEINSKSKINNITGMSTYMSGLVAGSLVQEMVQIIEKNVPLSWDHQCGKVHQKNCCTVHQDDTIQKS
jgi:hypothetical protein